MKWSRPSLAPLRMKANCCANGRPTSPKLAGQPHPSRPQNFCSNCKRQGTVNRKTCGNVRHPEPRKTARDLTFGHTSSNLCEREQIERSLAFARDDARAVVIIVRKFPRH